MQVTDRPSPDAPSLTQAIIVQMFVRPQIDRSVVDCPLHKESSCQTWVASPDQHQCDVFQPQMVVEHLCSVVCDVSASTRQLHVSDCASFN